MAFGDSNIVPGVIMFKVTPQLEQTLDMNPAQMNSDGFVSFNNYDVDRILRENGVREVKQTLKESLALKTLHRRFTEKHKQLGLHRWYEIKFPELIDPESIIYKLKQKLDIEYIEVLPKAEFFWTPNDNYFNLMWGLNNIGQEDGIIGADIGMINAWDIEKGNPEIIVAVIDQGINIHHPDLFDNMWENPYVPLTYGYNFYKNNYDIDLDQRHGTHVAGTIAAKTNNNIGVAGIAGGDGTNNSGVRIMSCQISNEDGDLVGDYFSAFIWAADNGAVIAQNSWGHRGGNQYLQDVIDYFINNNSNPYFDKGMVFAAAGNNNDEYLYSPAGLNGVTSVAAMNRDYRKAHFSNYGYNVDIIAPGVDILSTDYNNNYVPLNGTSMACPHVSGVAALICSILIGKVTDSNIILNMLLDSADPIVYDYNDEKYYNKLGTGLLRADYSLYSTISLLNGINTLKTFTVTSINKNEVIIQYSLYDFDNPIKQLILYSDNYKFGIPNPNINYNIGDIIEGGGTVLQFDNSESKIILHENLEAGKRYYYAGFNYSINNNGIFEYSGKIIRSIIVKNDLLITNFSYIFNNYIDYVNNQYIKNINKTYSNSFNIKSFTNGLDIEDSYLTNYSDSNKFYNYVYSIIQIGEFDFTNKSIVMFEMQHFLMVTKVGVTKALLQYNFGKDDIWLNLNEWTETTSNPDNYTQNISNELTDKKNIIFRLLFISVGSLEVDFWCIGSINITSS